MTTPLSALRIELHQLADSGIAAHSQRFFKTGKGEYGEGDRFIGIRVPVLRKLATRFKHLPQNEALDLLTSTIHEERLLGLIIMVEQYNKADNKQRNDLFQLYIDNTRFINNWDLVDTSVHHIVGQHLEGHNKTLLYEWAESNSVWERRMAVMATFYFIRKGEFSETINIAQKLMNDSHDLIHKAVGWMLREVGNRDRHCEESFLIKHYRSMPRTMLRYAIEKFDEPTRKKYLKGEM